MLKKITSNIIKNEQLFKLFRQDTQLPKAPNDVEKYIYGSGNFKLYALFAIIASAIAIYGQVIWIMVDKDRYPFLVSVCIFALFTILTYFSAFFRKSFKLKNHNILINQFKTNKPPLLPSVDIYLATCGEELEVLENAYKYVSKLEWGGILKVYVLDDKGDSEVADLAKKFNFTYLHRPNKGELKKAGNIRYAFSKTKGDYFIIFDADFCPRADFLLETMPYFLQNPKLGLIQTPQYFHLTKNSNYIEVGSTAKEEFFYRCSQPSRDSFNGSMCVGTNAIYKRKACQKMGGVFPLEHSEDIHTGFNLIKEGWKLKYIPLVLAKGMAPDNINAYFSQQYRWGLGTLMQMFDLRFWFARIPLFVKLNYINAIFYYITVSTSVVISPITILLTVMFFPEQVKFFEVMYFIPYFLFQYLIHPIWQKSPWSIKCISTNIIANTAYLFALFDLITGSTMDWIPTGQIGKKSGKKTRYLQFIWFLSLWHIASYSLIFYFSLMNMKSWDDYNFYPMLFLSFFNLIVVMAIFEPIFAIQRIIDNVLNLIGLKIFVSQLKSVTLVLFLILSLTSLTAFAMNKEGRSQIINTISSLNIDRNQQSAVIPVPVFNIKNKDGEAQIQKDLQSNKDALSNPKSTIESNKTEKVIEEEKQKEKEEKEAEKNKTAPPANDIPSPIVPKPIIPNPEIPSIPTPEVKPPTNPDVIPTPITPVEPSVPNPDPTTPPQSNPTPPPLGGSLIDPDTR
ncbi:MAG: glycosyltransferase family 2 protein [Patescibacteria group bacterium]